MESELIKLDFTLFDQFNKNQNTDNLLPKKYSGILETRKKKVPTKSISEKATAKKVSKIS